MARFIAGEVVVVPFPFSDLSSSKRRPALVVASLQGNDVILCQITSKTRPDPYNITLKSIDFTSGKFKHSAYIRPSRLFTADNNLILYSLGKLNPSKLRYHHLRWWLIYIAPRRWHVTSTLALLSLTFPYSFSFSFSFFSCHFTYFRIFSSSSPTVLMQ